jgi:hypothetical protein
MLFMFIADAVRSSGLASRCAIFRFLPYLLLSALFGIPPAVAHPVSQGRRAIQIHQNRIHLLAKVSLEEVLAATRLEWKQGWNRHEAIRVHEDYLLDHLPYNCR